MKRTYTTPIAKCVVLDTESMVANSPSNQDMQYGGKDNGQGVAESARRTSLWDE